MSPRETPNIEINIADGVIHSDDTKDKHTSSNIRDLLLDENVAGGRAAHTSVSILEPVMRIERTGDRSDPKHAPPEEYRIVLNFKLQVKLHAFDKGYRKKYDQLFDFISLRYLYDHEQQFRHEVIPGADPIATFNTSDETTRTKFLETGLSGNPAAGGVSPSLNYHVGRDNKLLYERTDAKSWKFGLSFESYQARKHTPEHAYRGHAQVRHNYHHHNFQVQSKHWNPPNGRCKCPDDLKTATKKSVRCPYRYPNHSPTRRYDRCAHWFWQTEALAHIWTPEIYDSFTEPITVTRILSTERFDQARKRVADKHDHLGEIPEEGVPFLHFDFDVTTRLRELGHITTADSIGEKFSNIFRTHSKPAEVHAKRDFGYPLKRDRVTFCIWACAAKIRWPRRPTLNLQLEAANEIKKSGGQKIYIMTSQRQHFKERRTKEQERHEKKHAIKKTDAKDKDETLAKFQNDHRPKEPRHLGIHYHHRRRDRSLYNDRNATCDCERGDETHYHHRRHRQSRFRHEGARCHSSHEHESADSESEADSDVEAIRGRSRQRIASLDYGSPGAHRRRGNTRRTQCRCGCGNRSPSSGSSVDIYVSQSEREASPPPNTRGTVPTRSTDEGTNETGSLRKEHREREEHLKVGKEHGYLYDSLDNPEVDRGRRLTCAVLDSPKQIMRELLGNERARNRSAERKLQERNTEDDHHDELELDSCFSLSSGRHTPDLQPEAEVGIRMHNTHAGAQAEEEYRRSERIYQRERHVPPRESYLSSPAWRDHQNFRAHSHGRYHQNRLVWLLGQTFAYRHRRTRSSVR